MLIGLSLDLLGSGSSILTVPVLVYLVGESGKMAIIESLAAVGLLALVGAALYLKKRCIDGRAVLLFGDPDLLGRSLSMLLIFAVVLPIAAVRMFQLMPERPTAQQCPWWQVMLAGVGVGVLTGVFGVGGGFLILPALVLLGSFVLD